MRFTPKAILLLGALSLLFVSGAHAQDVFDAQSMIDRALFAGRAAIDQRQAAERQRVDVLDQRAQQQGLLLQEQTLSLQKVSAQLQTMQDERQLIEMAQEFDAAILSKKWQLARSFLSGMIAVDLEGSSLAGPSQLSSDVFIANLPSVLAHGGVLPRSNQQVSVEGDQAILTSDGYSWLRSSRQPVDLGRYEYRFERGPGGWMITGVRFIRATED